MLRFLALARYALSCYCLHKDGLKRGELEYGN